VTGRTLRSRFSYWLVAIPTIALSLGANVVVLAVANTLWFDSRSMRDVSSLVVLMRDPNGTDSFGLSELGLQLAAEAMNAEGIAGQAVTTGLYAAARPRLSNPMLGRDLDISGVTANYFDLLGVRLHAGGPPLDEPATGEIPAVISAALWESLFDSAPSAIGSTLQAGSHVLRVTAIAPKGFRGARLGEKTDVWVPNRSSLFAGNIGARVHPVFAIARLRPGDTPEAAQARLSQSASVGLRALNVIPLRAIVGSTGFGMVAFNPDKLIRLAGLASFAILLGGAATLAAIVLIVIGRRQPEWSIKMALGASRGAIVRAVSAELSAMLLISLALTLALSAILLQATERLLLTAGLAFTEIRLAPDFTVGIGTLVIAIAMLAGATFAPLLKATAPAVMTSLLGRAGWQPSNNSTRNALLVVQVAVTMTVCVLAVQFSRTVSRGVSDGGGFDNLSTVFVSAQTSFPAGLSDDASASRRHAQIAIANDLVERLRHTSGVLTVAAGKAPIGRAASSDAGLRRTFRIDGDEVEVAAGVAFVGKGYCQALGLIPLAGDCPSQDSAIGGHFAAVTPQLAQELWPDQPPVGSEFQLYGRTYSVAAVIDVAYGSTRFGRSPAAFLFENFPLANGINLDLVLLVKDADALGPVILRELKAAFGADVSHTIETGASLMQADLGRERIGAWLFTAFATVAGLLALGGLVSLVRLLIESHRREFAIRSALGATRSSLVYLGASFGLRPVLFGVFAGVIGALLLSQIAEASVLGLEAASLGMVLLIGGAMAAVAGVAALATSWGTGRRTSIDLLTRQ
jgi:hypothetical protein